MRERAVARFGAVALVRSALLFGAYVVAMSTLSRGAEFPAAGRLRARLIRWLVPVGLGACLLANFWLEIPEPLPGVALGAAPVLVVERTAVLFLAWMLVLVMLVEASDGRLPLEISGRGVRYADAATTEGMARTIGAAIARMDGELNRYRQEQADFRRLLRTVDDRI